MPDYTHPINKAIRQKRREDAFERWKRKALVALAFVSMVIGGWPW